MSKLKPIEVPEIRFHNAWLLTDAFVTYTKQIEKFKDRPVPSWEGIQERIDKNSEIWRKGEKEIVTAMQKIVGLNFYQNIIDVYIVYGWKSAFSSPMVLSMRYEGEEFIDVLTHELLHRLITDNIQKKKYKEWLSETYPEVTDKSTLNHIAIHAIHKEIYLNVLKRPDRLEFDLKKCENWH